MSKRVSDADTVVWKLNEQGDTLSLRDFAQNTFITGVTGGGKTSGPGEHAFRGVIRTGAGAMVLCAKPGEAERIREICAQEGRLSSVITCNGRNHALNCFRYTLANLGVDGINGVTEYVMRVIEMTRNASALPGNNGDAFWLEALRVIIRYSLLPVYHATGTIRLGDLLAFVRSAPTSPEQFKNAEWRKDSLFLRWFVEASHHFDNETGERLMDYWLNDYARQDGKLRSNILAGFALLDRFNHGWLKKALCGETSIVPELCFEGAILIIDTPRATMGEDGIIYEMMMKDSLQTALLKRNALPARFRERYVVFYIDEYQEVATPRDAEILGMSRSSFSGSILLTQSIPAMMAKFGGQNARERTHHLIGNCGIRICCASSCAETNEYNARTIGKVLQLRGGYSHNQGSSSQFGMNMGEGTNWGVSNNSGSSYSSGANGTSSYGSNSSSGTSSGGNDSWGRNRGTGSNQGESWSQNEQMDFRVEAGEFAKLKNGGPANNNRVSAFVYQPSRVFKASGCNTVLVEFAQQ